MLWDETERLDVRIDNLKNYTETKITTIEGNIVSINDSIVKINGRLATLEEAQDVLEERVDSIETDVANLFDNVIPELRQLITAVDKKADSLDVRLNERIDSVGDALATLQNAINSQITSMEVQACTTPVLADFNINLGGIQSTLLASYVGENTAGLTTFHGEDLTQLPFFTERAGKVYVTLNPVGNDFSAAQLELIDSKGNPAPVTLNPMVASSADMIAGIGEIKSRAAAGTYIWEAAAFYNDKATAEANRVHFGDLTAIAKDIKTILKEHSTSGLKQLAKDMLASAITHANVPAYALAATYQNEKGEDRTVVSQYMFAANAVRPLGYTTDIEKYTKGTVQGNLPYIKELLNKFSGKLDFNGTIPDVTLQDFDINGSTISGMIYVGSTPFAIGSIKIDGTNSTLGHALAVEIAKVINRDNDGVIAMIEKALTDKAATIIGDAKGSSAVKNADKLIDFINKTLNGIGTRLDNANYYLQPIAFFSGEDNVFHHLSTMSSAPTVVSGSSLKLYPTSWTYDILNPAYLKYLKVKHVPTGMTIWEGVVGLGKDGKDINMVEVPALPLSGMYELTYDALDFFGNVSENTYYVQKL
ncbi:MAG: hypothetical protein HUK08_03315 [Bacteroidaceae bacterium]|nr:hypothetical protein [Bacteroidaceae bacterium]